MLPGKDWRARSRFVCILGTVSTLCNVVAGAELPFDAQTVSASPDSASPLSEVTVTAQRLQLLGTAATASEGVVDDEELQLTPQYRPGQLLETVPGLIVTLHSGEGKANQFLMRGYNRYCRRSDCQSLRLT
jgi:outer membrane cobalamin receptor